MATVGSIALAVLILLVMVTVHEAGHYLAGKKLKFGVDEFSVGFGPALFKRKNKRTGELFAVRLIPLGGYCAFTGEEDTGDKDKKSAAQTEEKSEALEAVNIENAEEVKPEIPENEEVKSEDVKEETAQAAGTPFTKMAPWKRIIVLVAGPLMNYLLALVCVMLLFFVHGQYEYKIYGTAESDYPAAYSLQEGDIITAIDGKNVYIISDYISVLGGRSEGDKAEFTLIRDGETVRTDIILQADCEFKNLSDTSTLLSALGVDSMGGTPVKFGFFETVGRGFVYSFKIGGTVLQAIGELLTGRLGLSSMGGPVTTITLTSKYATQSFASFLEICATIGVNLAVFNLLPIPALDGSKIVFTAIEWIRKKPLNPKVENIINTVGFILIIAFAVLVDILHFI